MRDPERLSSSNGVSDFERELLDAGKKETMPAALREQMERALGLSGAGAVAAGTPVRTRVEAATGVKASAMVWISAGVVVLGVVGGIVGARLGSRLFPPRAVAPVMATAMAPAPAPTTAPPALAPRPQATAPTELDSARGVGAPAPKASPARRAIALATPARTPARPRARAASSRAELARAAAEQRTRRSSPVSAATPAASGATVAPAVAATPLDDAPSNPPARAVAPRQQRPAPEETAPARQPVASSGDLRAEIDLVDGARAALRAGNPSEALDLLARHAVHFPRGALAPEETALRVEALMRLGRTAEARAYARRFVAANPASALAERLRRLVDNAATP